MEKKKCPFCGEEIAVKAKKCRFCGEWLDSSAAPQPENIAIANPQPPVQVQAQPQPVPPVQSPQPAPQPQYQSPQTAEGEYEEEIYEEVDDNPSFFKAYFVNPYIHRYADFKGYTTRKSFWLTYAATLILSVGLVGLILLLSSFGAGGTIVGSIISGLVGLALVVPGLALCARRLRDAGKNPWLILLGCIPVAGTIILLIFFCQESKYEDTEEEGHWKMPDWIVTGICIALLIVGIVLSTDSIGSGSRSYDLGGYEEVEEVASSDYDEETDGTGIVEDNTYATTFNGPSISNIADNIAPEYFTYKLETYKIGSDSRMEELFTETGSTNVPIQAIGMIGNDNISMQGWITEDGTLHGRYHNENGVNLDFNGYIRPDNSLYIQLGHDSQKSDWILEPVVSELPTGHYRYEGKWGKSQKDSYVTFSKQ